MPIFKHVTIKKGKKFPEPDELLNEKNRESYLKSYKGRQRLYNYILRKYFSF